MSLARRPSAVRGRAAKHCVRDNSGKNSSLGLHYCSFFCYLLISDLSSPRPHRTRSCIQGRNRPPSPPFCRGREGPPCPSSLPHRLLPGLQFFFQEALILQDPISTHSYRGTWQKSFTSRHEGRGKSLFSREPFLSPIQATSLGSQRRLKYADSTKKLNERLCSL